MTNLADLVNAGQFFVEGVRPGGARTLRNRLVAGAAALVVLGGLGLAVYRGNASTPPQVPPAPAVTVAAVAAHPVRLWSEFSGRLTAVDSADIRPEVNGRITEIRFRNGQQVHAGDILFVIDPRPYEAAVAKAAGDLATAETNARLAKTELDRATKLMGLQAVARDYYDQRVNASGVAQAAIESATAALTQAKLDVDHAYVKAPISGRVSRAEITVGNLVQTSPAAPLLTSIVSNDGIYADFEVDEQTYLQSVRAQAMTQHDEQKIPVTLTVTGDNNHAYAGTIESFDNRIDPGTGTIRARARFANNDGVLMPGMFVSIKLAGAADRNVILVPEDAVDNDQSKRFVFVVGGDSKAAFREVTLGQEVGSDRVVLSGLRSGEDVIVDGLQRVQPGAIVAPHFAGAATGHKLAAR
ncbi:MAG TPA: efflux RND transporter periplasmic adaptor subunit [Rhizomicrobium sp.]